jgi:hypothetical protein
MGASFDLDHGIALMGSATFARTAARAFDQSPLAISDGGLMSTAWQVAAIKNGVFADLDRLRFSVAQPLQVESGALEYRSLQVVDRETGELGLLSQRWNVASSNREYRAEAIYTAPVFDGRAEVSGFALLELNPRTAIGEDHAFTVGAQIRFGF